MTISEIGESIKKSFLNSIQNSQSEATEFPIREFHYMSNVYVIQNALAIQNYANSGTTLFKSLLDGHPSIVTSPSILNMQMMSALRATLNKKQLHELSPAEIILNCANQIGIITNPFLKEREAGLADLGLNNCGEGKNESIGIPSNEFLGVVYQLFHDTNPDSQKVDISYIYLLLTLSYKLTLCKLGASSQPSKNLIFVWDLHGQLSDIKYFLNDFPQAKFLHLIRNPLGAFDGLFEYINNRSNGLVLGMHPVTMRVIENFFLERLWSYEPEKGVDFSSYGFVSIGEYINKLPGSNQTNVYPLENIRSIYLESLHSQPKECLLSFCDWLGINFDECLLLTTFEGKIWGNRPDSKHTGLSRRNNNETKYLNWRDRYLVKQLTNNVFAPNETTIISKIKVVAFIILAILPFKSESIEYIAPPDLLAMIRKLSPQSTISLNFVEAYLIRKRNGNWLIRSYNLKRSEKVTLFLTESGEKILAPETSSLSGSYFCVPIDKSNAKIDIRIKVTVFVAYTLLLLIFYLKTRKAIYRAFFKNLLTKQKIPTLLELAPSK